MVSIAAFQYSSSPPQILLLSPLVVSTEKSKTTPFCAGIIDFEFLQNSLSDESET